MMILIGTYVLAVLIVLSVIILIFYLRYYIPKRFGNKKLGKILVSIVITFFLFICFKPYINRTVFKEYYAVKEFKSHGFDLNEDIKVLEWEGGDWYDIIQIRISETNQRAIIDRLIKNRYYDDSMISDSDDIGVRHSSERIIDTTVIRRYEDGYYYHHFYKEPGFTFEDTEIKLDTTKQVLNYIYHSD